MLGNFVAEGKPEVQTTMDRMGDPHWDDLPFFVTAVDVLALQTCVRRSAIREGGVSTMRDIP